MTTLTSVVGAVSMTDGQHSLSLNFASTAIFSAGQMLDKWAGLVNNTWKGVEMFRVALRCFAPVLRRTVFSQPSRFIPTRQYNCLVKCADIKSFGLPIWNKLWSRDVVVGKKGKRKTVKAVAKRFRRTGSGALKYWRAGKNHKMIVKSGRARRNLRKPRYVNKTQLKLLNKMLSGI